MEKNKNQEPVKSTKTTAGKKPGAKKKSSALAAASVARSATAQVLRHTDRSLNSTGTNISYEDGTAPGAGGSVGSGYASGKEAVDENTEP